MMSDMNKISLINLLNILVKSGKDCLNMAPDAQRSHLHCFQVLDFQSLACCLLYIFYEYCPVVKNKIKVYERLEKWLEV